MSLHQLETKDASITMSQNSDLATDKLRIIFAGTPEFAATSLTHIIKNKKQLNCEVVAVYTQPDRKSGRGQKVTASAVKKVALANNIVVEQPATFKKSEELGQQARETLKTYQADVMVVAAYGLILPLAVLEAPKFGCLNIHASILPRWRGAAPIHRAILAGDEVTGITIMQMDKGLDTGDMLHKVECAIGEHDTTELLHDKLASMGAAAIVDVLADLRVYQAKAERQEDGLACYAHKLSKEEGNIDWTQHADNVARKVRGMHPYPSTFSFINSKRIKIIEAIADKTNKTDLPAGSIVNVKPMAIMVACGDSSVLKITKLQFAGGKPLSAEQVHQGGQLVVGDNFDV